MKSALFLILLSMVITGCSTVDPTGGKRFDPQSKNQCMDICKEADMTFQSLVVVAGMAGCVCGNKEFQKSSNVGSVMGGIVAAITAEQQKNQQSSRR